MKLTYIYHSCFVLEAENITIIIDYFRDTAKISEKGLIHSDFLNRPGKLYLLSSHSHDDHFNPEILTWMSSRPDAIAIFSDDILQYRKASQNAAVYLKKGDCYEDADLKIEAFGSTDLGISFLISIQNRLIFHAGDLNNWHWSDESTPREAQESENAFLDELDYLEKQVTHLDLAMFPIDSRLGTDYMLGARQFVERIKVDYFVPMHFGEEYAKADAFKFYAEKAGSIFFSLSHTGESFDF